MKNLFICCLLFVVSSFVLAQSREEKLEHLSSRDDVRVTEVEKDILKLEYPNGKVIYKNIGDYRPGTKNKLTYSPTFDSTIIDLTTIDTTLYYHKYSFWQELPISNGDFDFVRIEDVNGNGKPELYGFRKFFFSDYEPVTVYEVKSESRIEAIYQYDSIFITRNIYDVNNDGELEVQLLSLQYDERFFIKESDSSLATTVSFNFNPDLPYQLDDPTFGNYDMDMKVDLVFDKASTIYIFEYNAAINNFDSVYRYQVPDSNDLGIGGYSAGDFDLDGKTDIVFSTVRGKVFVIENEGDNQYAVAWQGSVESNNAYIHTWTNDIDGNGKPEFWVLADAYYNGIGTTRITIFETDGNNSFKAVGRVDLVGVFSFYAGNMQTVDIDNDGTEEVAVCIDDNFLILKFNGSKDHHTYEVDYIKKNELTAAGENSVYFGATVYDLRNSGKCDVLISMDQIINQGGHTYGRRFTRIYSPDSLSSIVYDDVIIPKSIHLNQNYPNPFNPVTTVSFETDQSYTVSIKIYDTLGKEIKLLLNENLPAGAYNIQWNGKDNEGNPLPSGIYFIQLQAGSNGRQAGYYRQTIKSVLLK